MIYFDSAATSFHKPACVAQAVFDAMHHIGSDGRGTHAATLAASRLVYRCRAQVSQLFGLGNPLRAAFTANATEALNIAISGLFHAGDHVITTALEHNSVLRPLYRSGAALTVLPIDARGCIEYDALSAAVQPNTRAVVCTHISNVTGNVLDIRRIGAFCREHDLLFVLDVSQSAGVFDIDMQADHISVVCFTGHKGLLGPQGTGGLCVAEGIVLPPFLVGGAGSDSFAKTHPIEFPACLEAGTRNAHGLAGLSAALTWLEQNDIAALRAHEQGLAQMFYAGVRHLPAVRVYGDWATPVRGAIVALNIEDTDAGVVADVLQEDYGICTRAGAHCAPLLHEAFGTEEQGMVRFSFSHFNTEDEVRQGIAAIRTLCSA